MDLKKRRVLANLSRSELANKLCVHPNTISKWENGSQQISKSHEAALNAILNPFSEISEITLADNDGNLIAKMYADEGEIKAIVKDDVRLSWH